MASMKALKEVLELLGTRAAATGLRGLQEFAPIEYIDDVARNLGGGSRIVELATASPKQIADLGESYARAIDIDERLIPAYEAMRRGTEQQFDILTRPVKRGGMGVDVSVTDADPYDVTTGKGIIQMLDDLNNRRIAVLSTRATGGHPILSDAENDAFRAVHDVFGHAATGRGFNRHGEEAAFRAHASMYPMEARPALVSELRAQNAYLNKFGEFGPQKMFMAPQEYMALEPLALSEEQKTELLLDAIQRMRKAGRF